jgi:hypothetical protein
MRHLPLAVLSAVAIVVLTACAPAADPAPTRSATAIATPTATAPVPERVVGPGEKPPTVFDGDCEAALSVDELVEVTQLAFAFESAESGGAVGNLGGLNCVWQADGASLTVQILPQEDLAGARFPSDQREYYFEDCDAAWVCAWEFETDEIWLGGTFQGVPEMNRPTVDEWGGELGAQIAANHAKAGGEEWARDRAGWWPVLDCAAVAGAFGDLGIEAEGVEGGYHDPPMPGIVLADAAAPPSQCYITLTGADRGIEFFAYAGQAWRLPFLPEDEPVDLGVEGVHAYVDSGYDSSTSEGYSLTDGVNALIAYVPTDGPIPSADIVATLARATVHSGR